MSEEPKKVGNCPECGAAVYRTSPRGPAPVFCCNKHKVAFHSRSMNQGRALLPYLKAWRAARNRKADKDIGATCFQEVCAILDEMISDDREAGRPHPTEYARSLVGTGYRYMDRKATPKQEPSALASSPSKD